MNERTKDRNGDGSRDGVRTGMGTGVENQVRSKDRKGNGSGDRNESSFGYENRDEDANKDGNESGIAEGGGEVKKRKKPHKNCRRDQTLLFCTRHYLGRQGVALAGTRQLRSQGLVPVHAHRTEEVIGSENRKYRTGSGAGSELKVGTEMGTGSAAGKGMEREREIRWRRT